MSPFRIRSVLLALSFCLGCPAAFAQTSCPTSVASLNGWYGMVVSAYTLGTNSGPRYLSGALLFNGAGGISATHIYSGNGAASSATGTYAANADCSLTLKLTIGGGTVQVYTVGITSANEALGIEADANGVATIDLTPQYATVTTGLNFTSSSLNGSYALSCIGPQVQASDTNLAKFSNGTLTGTDPYNNAGNFAEANVPYTGTYTVNTDGTFAGNLVVTGTPFDFYGVISNTGKTMSYIYANVVNGSPTGGFAACSGGLSLESAAATSGSVTNVSLASVDNVYAIAANGSAPLSGGLDGSSYAYSATLLGKSVNWAGEAYVLGVSGSPSGVSSATIALPAGSFTNLSFLATGVFGNQTGQSFVVTYTDGTTTTLTQSLSDWGAPQNNSGESVASPMAYRVTPAGGTQTNAANWNLYGYSFALNSAKTPKSLTLPNARNVIVLAVNLLGTPSTTPTLTAQTVTFPAIGTQKAGTTVPLGATASSGLTVNYISTTTSVCTVSGSTASSLSAGTCSITASQAGNGTYAAAAPVTQTYTVSTATPTAQTITFPSIAAHKASTTVALGATASSGLAVTYTSTTTSVCTVSGSTASAISAGTCSITASQAGNGTYAAATPVSQSFTVSAATGTFTLSASPTSVTVTSPLCILTFCVGGNSASTTITVAPVSGFTGAVTFTATGLPSWITGTFSAASVTTSGSTKLTLTPNTGSFLHTLGTPITITGKSGTQTITTTVTLHY